MNKLYFHSFFNTHNNNLYNKSIFFTQYKQILPMQFIIKRARIAISFESLNN